jgi:hypothetical protein
MAVQTFRSKVDAWLVVVMGATAVLVLVVVGSAMRSGETALLSGLATAVVAVGLPAWIFATTRYQLTSDLLIVHSGPFRWRIPLSAITSVTPSRSLLAGPALSLDRLRIEYGRGLFVLISPRDMHDFLGALEQRTHQTYL